MFVPQGPGLAFSSSANEDGVLGPGDAVGTAPVVYTICAVLQSNDVSLSPDAASIVEGSLAVVKCIIEGTKKFIRFYSASWLRAQPLYASTSTERTVPTFYDDIVCLPAVKNKISMIQSRLTATMGSVHAYLLEWKNFRNLWQFAKKDTCTKFISTLPTCVGFDEKLLYYYNINRLLSAKPNVKVFKCMLLDLRTLKAVILAHVDEWTNTLGELLERTAQKKLDTISNTVEDYINRLTPVTMLDQLSSTLQLVSSVNRISLEVEMSYNDIQERSRTLEMYGIKSIKSIMTLSQSLPKIWKILYNMSKDIEYQVSSLTGIKIQ